MGLSFSAQGQTSLLEFNQENTDISANMVEEQEWLQHLLENPINLNKATPSELRDTKLLSEQQINDLFLHMRTNGPLMSVYELQVIPSWSNMNLPQLSSYFRINNELNNYNVSVGKLLLQGNHQIITRYGQQFPKRDGYLSNKYLGNPSQVFLRYKYNYSNKLYYGISGEKDAGEPMFKAENKLGFDFYSAHFFWKINRNLQTLALGDFHLNLAQGLTVYTGFGFNKTAGQGSIKKGGNTLKPYTSINEANFLRGIGCTFKFKNIYFSPFLSYRKIDASLQFTDSTQTETLSLRPQASGYHRTLTESLNKQRLGHLAYGAEFQYEQNKLQLGTRWIHQRFSESITFPTTVRNQFDFQGKTLNHFSVDYSYSFRKAHFFAETALSLATKQLHWATLHGLNIYPHQTLQLKLLHRYYSPEYKVSPVLSANAFAESTNPNNEHGFFLAYSFQPNRRWLLSGYFDYYSFPWLSFQSKKPSDGLDALFSLAYKPSKKIEFNILYKFEEKEKNTRIDLGDNNAFLITPNNKPYLMNAFPQTSFIEENNQLVLRPQPSLSKQVIEETIFISPHVNQSLRLQLSLQVAQYWTLKTRASFSFFNDQIHSPSRGTLLFQEIKFKHPKLPFTFNSRISYFDIQSFDSRIYTYESDVLYQFSIPAFFDSGIRFYLNTSIRINRQLQLWARFAHTSYTNVKSKGSGNETINSNKLYDLKLQLRFSF